MTNNKMRLRPVEREDLEFLRDLANDPVVRAKVVGWDWPLSLAGQEKWFDRADTDSSVHRFIAEDENGPAGMAGLWEVDWHNRTALVAVKLGGRPDVRGRGLGIAVVDAIMDFAFNDVGLNRLHSTILDDNDASLALFVRKAGWSVEGRLRSHVWRSGDYHDLVQVGILRSEYEARRPTS
nr:GNAT family protein [Leifsonia sp. Leaf325]